MTKVAIIGASGYTGGELARLLSRHPHAEIVAVTSEKSKGKRIDHLFPNLAGRVSLELEPLDIDTLSGRADLFFLALPHTQAMEAAGRLIRAGKSVIDLSADFRLRDPKQYEAWYGKKHSFPELCEEAVYGLPEQYREAIKKARLVANPGCYPT
ncbi:MAG TPA: saccharopine dehydrogenase NADP-binding domain-containing protein, partial [Nitrospiria bacterium]|nr:saccharopine dehydrogenase NADP-binding domain-containing protein [Nitrospiria bacterium]